MRKHRRRQKDDFWVIGLALALFLFSSVCANPPWAGPRDEQGRPVWAMWKTPSPPPERPRTIRGPIYRSPPSVRHGTTVYVVE